MPVSQCFFVYLILLAHSDELFLNPKWYIFRNLFFSFCIIGNPFKRCVFILIIFKVSCLSIRKSKMDSRIQYLNIRFFFFGLFRSDFLLTATSIPGVDAWQILNSCVMLLDVFCRPEELNWGKERRWFLVVVINADNCLVKVSNFPFFSKL